MDYIQLDKAIKHSTRSFLLYYNYKLLEGKVSSDVNVRATDIPIRFSLDDLLKVFAENYKTIEETPENVSILMETLHNQLLCSPKEDIRKSVEDFIKEFGEREEIIPFVLQIVYQIVKTLQSQCSPSHIVGMKEDEILIKFLIKQMISKRKLNRATSIICITEILDILWSREDDLEILKILQEIWERIAALNRTVECLEIFSQMVNLYLKTFNSMIIFKDSRFSTMILNGICNKDSRKYANFTMKMIISAILNMEKTKIDVKEVLNEEFYCAESNAEEIISSWTSYLTILGNMEENQSHLILPSLKMLKDVKLNSKWMEILYTELLTHRNSLVLKWIINFILENRELMKIWDETPIEILLNGLNNTYLYIERTIYIGDKLSSFLRELNQFSRILSHSRNIDWHSIPLHFLLKTINKVKADIKFEISFDSVEKSSLYDLASKIRKVQNRLLRNNLRWNFLKMLEETIAKNFSLKDYLHLIESMYNGYEPLDDLGINLLERYFLEEDKNPLKENVSISFKIIEVLSRSSCNEVIFKRIFLNFISSNKSTEDLFLGCRIICSGSNDKEIKTKLLNKLKTIIQKFPPEIQEFLLLLMDLINEDSWKSNENIKLECLKYFQNEFKGIKIETGTKELNLSKLKKYFIDEFCKYLRKRNCNETILEHTGLFLDTGGVASLRFIVNALTACSNGNNLISYEILDRIFLEIGILLRDNTMYDDVQFICVDLIQYLSLQTEETTFIQYVLELLDLINCRSDLAFIVFQKIFKVKPFSCLNNKNTGLELLNRCLIFGDALYANEKSEYDYITRNHLDKSSDGLNISFRKPYEVRELGLKCIYTIQPIDDGNETVKFCEVMRDYFLSLSLNLNEKKSRYFDNSRQHRMKLRIMQTLAIIQRKNNTWDDRFLIGLFNENNQINITYIMELIIANSITKNGLISLLNKSFSYSTSKLSSLFVITYMSCRRFNEDSFALTCIEKILPSTFGQHFNTRLYAQVVIYHLINNFKLPSNTFKYLRNAIEESIKQGNYQENLEKLNGDFRFNLSDYNDLLNPFIVLEYIPEITKIASDEKFHDVENSFLLNKASEIFVETAVLESSKIGNENVLLINKEDETKLVGNDNEFLVQDVQRKMSPGKLLLNDTKLICYTDKNEEKKSMIVVASLISKAPNLGGIARTCEVLGIKHLVLSSLNYIEDKEFKTLSMTAEKWLNISEVKGSSELKKFLLNRKLDGFSIVGAEQTANSVDFSKFKYSPKTILLLGHEKQGIPGDLISLLDYAVEIPQLGMVRSLNVHVTGALFMWEYCKQHLQQK